MSPEMRARVQILERNHYKFHVTSRSYRVHWRQYTLCDEVLFDDEGSSDEFEHVRLAAHNFNKAVLLAEKHMAATIKVAKGLL